MKINKFSHLTNNKKTKIFLDFHTHIKYVSYRSIINILNVSFKTTNLLNLFMGFSVLLPLTFLYMSHLLSQTKENVNYIFCL